MNFNDPFQMAELIFERNGDIIDYVNDLWDGDVVLHDGFIHLKLFDLSITQHQIVPLFPDLLLEISALEKNHG